ncbi:MAG: RDD family protein [Bacteroidales bacterium]
MVNIICPHCKSEVSSDNIYCPQCGRNLAVETPSPEFCPKCGKPFISGARFCATDGTPNPAFSGLGAAGGGASGARATTYSASSWVSGAAPYDYPKASLGMRFVAFLVDFLVQAVLYIPAMICFFGGIFGSVGGLVWGADHGLSFFPVPIFGLLFGLLMGFVLLLAPLAYALLKDGMARGQSIGKRAAGIMVIDLDENIPCGKAKSLLRNLIPMLLAIVPFVGWLIEPIMVLIAEDGRRLGDRVASTQVIDCRQWRE